MSNKNISLGKAGETLAVGFLKDNGYKVLKTNYRIRLGEIDIIAHDRDTVCFIEVKTRNSLGKGLPVESVGSSKQRQISKVALCFLKDKNLLNKRARFDVVSILYVQGIPKIDLIKNAFELGEGFTY